MNIRIRADQAEAMVGFLQDLVRIPSLSTHEEAVAQRFADEMRNVGFADVWTDRVGNVVGRIGSGTGPKLLFNGHMDTVDVGGPIRWPNPPYEG
ncbi:MAG: YgeY family selenium metabolism-linked hydrolase, partial [Anaerolineae bacterium]